MSICKWCGRRPATEADHGDDDTDPKNHLCWREWNDYSDCHDIEQKLRDLAPLMRDTILALEASVNAPTREETERLYIKAAYMRKRVMDTLEDLLGGGGAVGKSGITPLPSAAGAVAVTIVAPELERQKDKPKPKDSYEDSKDSSKETRKTSAGTYWSEDTRPIPVPEPSSPIILLAVAGLALLSRRARK